MLVTRSGITRISSNKYSKVVTIATRYSLLRKQFKNANGEEISVLDYQTQQAKIISRIGELYAFWFTAQKNAELSSYVFN